MSDDDRMADVIESGMVLRRMDIELGRQLERERITKLLTEYPDDMTMDIAIALIEGENE